MSDERIKIQEINKHTVKPLKLPVETRPVKAADLCSDLYTNIALIAPMNCGKSTVIYYMLKNMCDKNTIVVAFVSTFYNDPIWEEIAKMLKKKGVRFQGYMSMKDSETGEDHLQELQDHVAEKARAREEEKEDQEEEEEDPMDLLHAAHNQPKAEEEEKKERKPKCQAPEYIIICDDLGEEIRALKFAAFLKKSRHYHVKTIVSTQYLKDMLPSARKQIKLWLLFSGLSESQVLNVHDGADLRMDPELFYQLYKRATTKTAENPKPFFYVYSPANDFRISFDRKFKIPEKYL
jgi:hypothetical protein